MSQSKGTLSLVPDEMERRDAYRLLLSAVIPRPIAWVSTLSADGAPNLAPYSFANAVGGTPPTIMFSVSRGRGRVKDTLLNVQATGEFVLHLVDETLAEAMNLTAGEYPQGVNEFEVAGLETAPSIDVKPPRVAAAPVAMEAKVSQIIPVDDTGNMMVLGRVLRYHIREGLVRPNGLIDPTLLRPIVRLGGTEYATLGEVFSMIRPSPDAYRRT